LPIVELWVVKACHPDTNICCVILGIDGPAALHSSTEEQNSNIRKTEILSRSP
jgi:hypothetical protein